MRGSILLAAAMLACGTGTQTAVAQSADAAFTGLDSAEAEVACLRAALARRQAEDPRPQATDPVSPPPASSLPSGMGREQVELPPEARGVAARREEPREQLRATIVETRQDRRGLLVMQLDNGQIWRQDESLAVPFEVDGDDRPAIQITPSGFGGYRMEFPQAGRRIVVSRLR